MATLPRDSDVLSVADDLRIRNVYRNAEIPYRGLHPKVYTLQTLSWTNIGCSCEIGNHASVGDLERLPEAALRVIFAPLNDTQPGITAPTMRLVQQLGLPPCFLAERLRAAPYSFGHRSVEDESLLWFHYICKNVEASSELAAARLPSSPIEGTPQSSAIELHDLSSIQAKVPVVTQYDLHHDASRQSRANFDWIKSSFAIKIRRDPITNQIVSVTLLCFGSSIALQDRLKGLQNDARWQQILQDPLILFSMVFDELYEEMDVVGWNLADVFGSMETFTLNTAQEPTEMAHKIDFVGLHNISKQSIYLLESVACFLEIIDKASHVAQTMANSGVIYPSSHELISYNRTAVHATQLRLTSLDKRINNLISLSFNLVTQSDSRTLKVDSKLMILIALITIIFLPTNTIASIFSGPFFDSVFRATSDTSQPDQLFMLSQFWLFWAIAVPITTFVLFLGWWYFQRVKKELLHGRQEIGR